MFRSSTYLTILVVPCLAIILIGCPSSIQVQREDLHLEGLDRGSEKTEPIKVTRYYSQQGTPHRLILLSGWACGPGWFEPLAKHIAQQGTFEVWLPWRRGIAFARKINTDNTPPGELPEWGLAQELADIDAVVAKAKEAQGKVVLGGWSAGAIEALAYAAREQTDGSGGYTLLSGLVLIDGIFPILQQQSIDQLRAYHQHLLKLRKLGLHFNPWLKKQIALFQRALDAFEKDPEAESKLAQNAEIHLVKIKKPNNRQFLTWLLSGVATGTIGEILQIGARRFGYSVAPQKSQDSSAAQHLQLRYLADTEPTVSNHQVVELMRHGLPEMDPWFPNLLWSELIQLILANYSEPQLGITAVEQISLPLFLAMGSTSLTLMNNEQIIRWLEQHLATKDIAQRLFLGLGSGELLIAREMRLGLFERLNLWLGRLR